MINSCCCWALLFRCSWESGASLFRVLRGEGGLTLLHCSLFEFTFFLLKTHLGPIFIRFGMEVLVQISNYGRERMVVNNLKRLKMVAVSYQIVTAAAVLNCLSKLLVPSKFQIRYRRMSIYSCRTERNRRTFFTPYRVFDLMCFQPLKYWGFPVLFRLPNSHHVLGKICCCPLPGRSKVWVPQI